MPSSRSISAATISLLLSLPLLAAFPSSPALAYSTYLGGPPGSNVGGFAVDSSGYAYVSGGGGTPAFPYTDPPPPNCSGNFLAKLNLTGSGLVWARCLPVLAGGPIALDSSGSIYVAGFNNDSLFSSVLTKLSPDATMIVYSVTIPDANVRSIAVDASGSLYASGLAQPRLKTTPAAYQTRFRRSYCSGGDYGDSRRPPPPCYGNAFALKLDPGGAIKYVTFLPAFGAASAIAVDSQGNIWTTGRQDPNPAVFVAKLDAAGANQLFLDTFSGEENHADEFHGIAVDNEDSAYVVSQFWSGGGSLPEGFIRKYTAAGKLVYEKSPGGSPAVAVDAQGDAYFGISGSSDPACQGQWATTHIMALSPDASSTVSDTCFPAGYSFIALDGHGGLYLAGTTQTSVFLTTFGAFQTKYPGGPGSGYVAKFDLTRPSGPALVSLVNAVSFLPGIGNSMGELDGAAAPGEIVTLIGHDFPSSDASMKVTFTGSNGNVWTAPLLSANSNQVSVAVPFEVAPPQTLVSISTNSQTVDLTKVPVVAAQPAILTADAGQPAIFNQDGTLNASANPARAGSQLSVFLMGAGQYNGVSLPDGSLGPSQPPFPSLQLGVSGGIAGPRSSGLTEQVTVIFAGQAPGLLAGISQINLRLPDDAPTGPGNLCLYVGGFGVANATGYGCTPINVGSP